MSELLLPLFPLQVVLFPRTRLALHIFEERYKEMIGECLEQKREFGVVLLQERSLENTGCTASITEVVRRYDDGRMDIRVRGGRRFELLLLNQDKAYLRGAPQFFEDEAGEVPAEDERRKQAMELYVRMAGMLVPEEPGTAEPPPDASDPQLSFQIVGRLPADVMFKQGLLQLRSENERLTRAVPYLEKMASHLEVVLKTRRQAGGNGRGRWVPPE